MYAKNSVAELINENERLKEELQLLRSNNTVLVKELYGSNKQGRASSEKGRIAVIKSVESEIEREPVVEIPKFMPRKKLEKTVVEQMYEQKFPKETIVDVEPKKKKIKPYVLSFIMIFGICFNVVYINAVGDGYKDSIETHVQTITDAKNQIETQGNAIQKNRNDIVDLMDKIDNLSDTVSKLTAAQQANASTLDNISKSNLAGYYLVPGTDKHDLEYLKKVVSSWQPLQDYKENVYDCSNMAAHLEWYLEANGIKSDIVMGQPSWAKTTHAWVFAYGSFGKVAIEATKKSIVYETGPFWINADASYFDSKNIAYVWPSVNDIPSELTKEFEWRNLAEK